MPLLKITGQGLCSIAALTGVLWGCIFMEQLTVARARASAQQALQEIRALQHKKSAQPAAAPVPAQQPPGPIRS